MPHPATDPSTTRRLPLFSKVSPLTSQCFYAEFNEAGSGDGDGDKGSDGDKGEGDQGDKGSGDGDKGGSGSDKGKGGKGTEGRIDDLVGQRDAEKARADAAEQKLKDIETEKRQKDEDKLKEEGKLKELLDSKETELADLTGSKTQLDEQLKSYEGVATAQIEKALESIEDEEKKTSVEALLEGKSTLEKYKMLPEVLKLVGTGSSDFGSATQQSSKSAGKQTIQQKNERYMALLDKERTEKLSSTEIKEKETLMNEIQEASWDS